MSKNTFLKIRASDEELEKWKGQANSEGTEFSVWVRKRLEVGVVDPAWQRAWTPPQPLAEEPTLPAKCGHGELKGNCPYTLCRNYGYRPKERVK